jgi:hypothetical protein
MRPRQSIVEQMLGFPVLLASALATFVFLLLPTSIDDPDIWWHLRNAQYQVSAHAFIYRDMYSFTTKGAPWMNHEWLAELPFYAGWRLYGDRGLFLVMAAAVECIFLGVFYLAWRHGKNPKAALATSAVAAFLATVSYGPRTLLFGWIALVAELVILDRFLDRRLRARREVLWMLPLLFGIWVNTHGSWLIGMVVLVTFFAAGCRQIECGCISSRRWTKEQLQVLGTAAIMSIACLFINPYGWRLVAYPFNLAFHQRLNIANVDEWASLDFHSVRGHVFLVTLALLFFAQIFRPRKWELYQLAFLFLGVYSAFTYCRFLFLAAILIFPMITKGLDGVPRYRPELNRPRLNACILCILFGMAWHHLHFLAHKASATAKSFPDAALPLLRSFHPQGKVFNDYRWGGYMEWNLRQIPTFVDSRVDIFEYAGVFRDYLDAIRLKDTIFILDKYDIQYVLFEADSPFVYFLQQTHAWKVDYRDATTILLERVTPIARTPAKIPSPAAAHE